MVTPPDIEAQILRYYHAEKWTVGTIATQLHVHHSVVRRVLAQAGLPRHRAAAAAIAGRSLSAVHPPDAGEVPKADGQPAVRDGTRTRLSRQPRPLPPPHRLPSAAAEGRSLSTATQLPGEQAQIDWAHFGYIVIGRARRPLMAFVMVLSHSRQIFLRFFPDARMENFLRGHVGAFQAWQGVPRVLLYDNLKSAVLERHGDAIRFHPTLLNFAGHYRYEPRPVAVARGNEKGRVERAIRYIRDSFFAARSFDDIDDLNAQAEVWCNGQAADRRCPEEPARTVREVFTEEATRLLRLPDNPAPLLERVEVKVGKTPYVRFDLNDYSVPHSHVQRVLTVLADPHELRIVDGAQILARHRRSYDKGAQIEDPAHIQALVDAQACSPSAPSYQSPRAGRSRQC